MPTSSPPRGDVRMNREGYHLRADSVTWNRVSGEVRAEGNVRVVSPEGDVAYGDSVVLEDTLRDGVVENLLLVLEDGGRLAASRARAARTASPRSTAPPTRACAVVDAERLPEGPDLADQRGPGRPRSGPPPDHLSGRDASTCSARRSSPCPACPIPTAARAAAAACWCPRSASAAATASSSAVPYYIRLAPNRDATITPHVYHRRAADARGRISPADLARRLPAARLRHLRLAPPARSAGAADAERQRRASAPISRATAGSSSTRSWSITASGRYVTDRTFLRRYDISRDDRLRSFVDAERITDDSYISIAGWAFQGLRLTDVDGHAADRPAGDRRALADRRSACSAAGSSCRRTASPSSAPRARTRQRAFASARWDRRSITAARPGAGADRLMRAATSITPTTPLLTQTVDLSRRGGLERPLHRRGRGRPALAVRRRLPRRHPAADAARSSSSPRRRPSNLDIPNEDARSVDLEDSQPVRAQPLPRLRPLGGRRARHLRRRLGARPARHRRSAPTIGQSYRLDQPARRSCRRAPAFPAASPTSSAGPTSRSAAIVSLIHRFRLDKDSLALRRNEIDATVGGRRDLCDDRLSAARPRHRSGDRGSARPRGDPASAAASRFARYWSIFGSAVIDLTSRQRGPALARRRLRAGPPPARHRSMTTIASSLA